MYFSKQCLVGNIQGINCATGFISEELPQGDSQFVWHIVLHGESPTPLLRTSLYFTSWLLILTEKTCPLQRKGLYPLSPTCGIVHAFLLVILLSWCTCKVAGMSYRVSLESPGESITKAKCTVQIK